MNPLPILLAAVCHRSCLDTKLFSIFMSLFQGAPVSSGFTGHVVFLRSLFQPVCDVCMVSRKHMEQKISHIFPDDLELLLNSTSISNECWKKSDFFLFKLLFMTSMEQKLSPLDQKQSHSLHSSYKFNSQNVLKLLENSVNCFHSKLKKVTVPKVCLV